MKNRLKELRQHHQWSQADLARKLGISRQAANGFESGKFDPSLEMAFKIAHLFNVTVEDVFIYEAIPPMQTLNPIQTLVKQVTKVLGFEIGFERFTDDAVNAVKVANHQALRSQSPQVEPEHLLAGLFAAPDTTSGRLLRANSLTMDLETFESPIEFSGKQPGFSRESQFVFELALKVVRLKGKRLIGTEHLLWGLVQLTETGNPVLANLCQCYGINLETLKQQLAETV